MQLLAKGRNNPVMTIKNTILIPVLTSDDDIFTVSVDIKSLALKPQPTKLIESKNQVNFYNDKYDQ